MVLVDTSVWIEVFRRSPRVQLTQVVSFDEVATCLPIIQEVLQGFRDDAAYKRAKTAMLALPTIEAPLEANVYVEAAQLYRTARKSGLTVRSGVDCLIAACAIRNDISVLHRDRDFDALARVSSLRARSVE